MSIAFNAIDHKILHVLHHLGSSSVHLAPLSAGSHVIHLTHNSVSDEFM